MLHSYLKSPTLARPSGRQAATARAASPRATPQVLTAKTIASIYTLTPTVTPRDVVVAVIGLGGGLRGRVAADGTVTNGDVHAYWRSEGIAAADQPRVKIVLVDGAVNDPLGDVGSTTENTVDVETVGSCCPGSRVLILLYLAPNTLSGFYNAFLAAKQGMSITISNTTRTIRTNTTVQYPPAHVITCSWGAPERSFDRSDLYRFDALFEQCAQAGVNICCASGDNGSSDGAPGLNVDFPASSPHVVGCGGTRLTCPNLSYDDQTDEVAWTDGGGGVSAVFPLPLYQHASSFSARATESPSALLTISTRCVPDLALNADPNTGVSYFVNGSRVVIGGTSIVAPAVAAFIAAAGITYFLNPRMYACRSTCFHDIRGGNNGAYIATPGYDLVTGLGSLDGQTLLTQLSAWVPLVAMRITLPVPQVSAPLIAGGVGVTCTLSVTPEDATQKAVTWAASNVRVATVSPDGHVTPKVPGVCSITALSVDGTCRSNNLTITVRAVTATPPATPVSPPATATPVSPPATATPVSPPATATPVSPPATATPVSPPATATPVSPPATTTPVSPPATAPPMRMVPASVQAFRGHSFNVNIQSVPLSTGLTWRSNNTAVATVVPSTTHGRATLRCVTPGRTVVTCTLSDGSVLSCAVKVV